MSRIITLTCDELRKQDLSILVNIIYNNFIELNNEPKLMHTKEAINETLIDDNVIVLLVLNESNQIIGFLVGQKIKLDNRRKVLFIKYIYVAELHRHIGIGTQLMDMIESIGYTRKLNGIMLIFDTSNKKLVQFYENRGYMLDFNLRRYEKHDVFYKSI